MLSVRADQAVYVGCGALHLLQLLPRRNYLNNNTIRKPRLHGAIRAFKMKLSCIMIMQASNTQVSLHALLSRTNIEKSRLACISVESDY